MLSLLVRDHEYVEQNKRCRKTREKWNQTYRSINHYILGNVHYKCLWQLFFSEELPKSDKYQVSKLQLLYSARVMVWPINRVLTLGCSVSSIGQIDKK